MRSNNPIFNRSPEFSGQSSRSYAGQPLQPGLQPGYDDPSSWGTGGPVQPQGERMTIDSVVMRTAMTLGVVIVVAAATWLFIGDITAGAGIGTQENAAQLTTALLVGTGLAFGLSLVNSFKRVVSPALVLAFAAAEGVALGAYSKLFDALTPSAGMGGVVVQAVVGTFAAFAGTLAAYKFFDIQVTSKFRRFVIAAMFGMVALGLMEMVLGFFGNAIGFFGFGGLGLLFAVAGLVLGIFMLILDFDMIENGVAAGLPERESWRAAFGLTVSLVWIYTNLLRILSILQQD